MPKIVNIALSDKSYPVPCDLGGLDLKIYDFVIVSGRGDGEEETGYVHGFAFRCEKQTEHLDLRRVLRRAAPREVRAWHFLRRREYEALALCKEKVAQHNLDMRVSQVKFDERQRKVIFQFTADKRVDFRELVKDLAATFHARIELWQIGVRDETRQMGGMGVCGCKLCCAAWLKEFLPVSIRYAKVQDIPFSPAKLSGVCGRLRCCLAYEQAQYAEMGKGVPPIGATIVSTDYGEAKVVDRNLLTQTLSIQDGKGQMHVISCAQVKQVKESPDSAGRPAWTFDAAGEEDVDIAQLAAAEEEAYTVPEVRYRDGTTESSSENHETKGPVELREAEGVQRASERAAGKTVEAPARPADEGEGSKSRKRHKHRSRGKSKPESRQQQQRPAGPARTEGQGRGPAQTRPEPDRGGRQGQARPDVDRGGRQGQARPDADRGGRQGQARPDADRGGRQEQPRPDADRGGRQEQPRPDADRGGAGPDQTPRPQDKSRRRHRSRKNRNAPSEPKHE